jgi:predicted MPP superfamily phosphohydrolase
MPLFILLIILTVVLLDAYWWWRADRLLCPLRRRRTWRMVLALFMSVQAAGFAWIILSRGWRLDASDPLPRWLTAAVFAWHLLVMPMPAILCLLVDIGRALTLLVRRLVVKPKALATEPSPPPAPITRRQLLGATIAALPPLATAGLTIYSLPQLDRFRIRPLTLVLPMLPRDLDGLTIAHVTDIHVGRFTTGRVLSQIVEQSNAPRADLVLMTGDLINTSLSDLAGALDVVRKLDAKRGIFLCEGNHDLIDSGPEFRHRTKAAGVPLLVNESEEFRVNGAPLQLLGLRWGTGLPIATRATERGDDAIRRSMNDLLRLRRPDAFPILLAHHPHAFDPAAEAGLPLTLSGHTHGGQLMLSKNVGFGPMMFRYWSGLYAKGNSQLVVSNGVGNWFPVRVNAPAEIVHLTLRRG